MKVNFDTLMKTLDGKPFDPEKDAAGKDVPIVLKLVCVRALTTGLPEDQSMSGETAFKRLELARKINAGGEVEIDPADAILLRDRAAKMFPIQIGGQVHELLQG